MKKILKNVEIFFLHDNVCAVSPELRHKFTNTARAIRGDVMGPTRTELINSFLICLLCFVSRCSRYRRRTTRNDTVLWYGFFFGRKKRAEQYETTITTFVVSPERNRKPRD